MKQVNTCLQSTSPDLAPRTKKYGTNKLKENQATHKKSNSLSTRTYMIWLPSKELALDRLLKCNN